VIAIVLGVLALGGLLAATGAFSRADVATLKSLGVWIVGLAGLSLATLLLLTGREPAGLGILALTGTLAWNWLPQKLRRRVGAAPRRPSPRSGMSRGEAYEVLGLEPGASEAAIRAAHRRLVRGAHPDAGGSAWLAARINQARDVLLP
jgi:hypothetical protein